MFSGVTDYILRHENYFRKVMEEQLRVESSEKLTVLKKQLARNEKRIGRPQTAVHENLRGQRHGKLSDDRFDMMSQSYDAEQKQLEEESSLSNRKSKYRNSKSRILKNSSRKRTSTFILKNSLPMLSVNWCRLSM